MVNTKLNKNLNFLILLKCEKSNKSNRFPSLNNYADHYLSFDLI
jgi:hypothetical protein